MKSTSLVHAETNDGTCLRDTLAEQNDVVPEYSELSCSEQPGAPLDPIEIFAMAKLEPLRAALECQKGLSALEGGYQEQRRRYIAATYASAYYISQDEATIVELDQLLLKHRVTKKLDVNATRERLVYRMFELTFAKTGKSSSNAAYRYAYGLEHYFASRTCPEDAAAIVIKMGPEKLYKEAVRRNQGEKKFAEKMNQDHLERLKINGRYALQILGIDADSLIGGVPRSEEQRHALLIEANDQTDDVSDEEDDEVEGRPGWRCRVVEKRFEKMFCLATQLSQEMVDSKRELEDDQNYNDEDDGILRHPDDIKDTDWKSYEIDAQYFILIQKAINISIELERLKALLKERLS